jgi:membrane-bound lytic murein transglycosylase F
MTQHKKTIVILISLSGLFVTTVILFEIMSQPSLSQLERIKKAGVLTVLTRSAPTTYYEGSNGPAGFEYDLASLFAEHIGVSATFKTPATFSQVLSDIQTGKADIAAAGITITEQRKKQLTFTPPYHEITEQIIYRTGTQRPETTQDLSKGILEVVKGTSHADTLKKLKKIHPKLQWYTNDTLDTDGLLFLINQKLIDFTIADSNQITLIRRFYPQLHVAFDISPPRQLAWALQSSPDQSLYRASVKFFESIKQNKILEQLIDRHFGYAEKLNYATNCTFRQHIKSRLPYYQKIFESAAFEQGLDWRLIAAIGYQESHWRKNAISPTGVRGIMMLTRSTAKQLGFKNRIKPENSIRGGALYFKQRLKRIPVSVPDPDRTWMALAAYNIGYGHLNDARILTKNQGDNPNKWLDVKKHLPLLSQKKWYQKTKYGYARGHEPVLYVEKVRNYYDLLTWLTEDNSIERQAMKTQTKSSPQLDSEIAIINPAI